MRIKATFINGTNADFLSPVLVTINIDEYIPADSAVVMIKCHEFCEEIKEIAIYDNQNILFDGIVDEQCILMNPLGSFVKIYARSRAALLIDNCALPKVYNYPYMSMIFENHVKPYQFGRIMYDKDVYIPKINISKGMSEWDVLNCFCFEAFKKDIRIRADRNIFIDGIDTEDTLIFSDSGNGISYIEFSEDIKRHEEISEIYVKTQKQNPYKELICNQDSVNRGIRMRRCIDFSDNSNEALINSQYKINISKELAYQITLSCYGCRIPEIWTAAEVENRRTGKINNLYISKIRYSLNEKVNKTDITLRREVV